MQDIKEIQDVFLPELNYWIMLFVVDVHAFASSYHNVEHARHGVATKYNMIPVICGLFMQLVTRSLKWSHKIKCAWTLFSAKHKRLVLTEKPLSTKSIFSSSLKTNALLCQRGREKSWQPVKSREVKSWALAKLPAAFMMENIQQITAGSARLPCRTWIIILSVC